jgi:hypothetical protein
MRADWWGGIQYGHGSRTRGEDSGSIEDPEQEEAMRIRPLLSSLALYTLAASAQSNPQTYLDAYSDWRKLDPSLERDAATAGPQSTDRVARAFAASSKYTLARSTYLRSVADESGQFLLWLQNSASAGELDLEPAAAAEALVSAQSAAVSRDIAGYANDPDRGIQQLRQALEKERAALAALAEAISNRGKGAAKAAELVRPAEDARSSAMAKYQALAAAYSAAAAEAEREEPSWASYYQALSDAIAHPAPPPRTLASTVVSTPAAGSPQAEEPKPVTIGGVRIMNPADGARQQQSGPSPRPAEPPSRAARLEPPKPVPPEPESARPAPAPTEPVGPAPVKPAPAAATPAVVSAGLSSAMPPLPLSRYVGSWSFPVTGGLSFGAQPESVALEVQEVNGTLKGKLTARFKPADGVDPELSFDFAGPVQPTRKQKLSLVTAEGATGSIDLIPGTAFNLLEINFQTDVRPRKVRLGNFVLVKN